MSCFSPPTVLNVLEELIFFKKVLQGRWFTFIYIFSFMVIGKELKLVDVYLQNKQLLMYTGWLWYFVKNIGQPNVF